jgi:thiol-disulfide isomerase/thioredoxin
MRQLKMAPGTWPVFVIGLLAFSISACSSSSNKDAVVTTRVPSPTASTSGESHDTSDMTPKLKGKQAPDFTLKGLDGKTLSLSSFRGRPVVLNFWATWCGPCKVEMPWFEEFSKKYADRGLVVLGVANDDASPAAIKRVADKIAVTYPIFLKDGHVVKAYGGLEYLPETFYIDPQGNVSIETAGANANSSGKTEIERDIVALLAASGH